MRNNQPVYDQEYTLHDEQYLISRTDARGRIIYANPAFVEVSGFSREELVGSAHNIVRHPDMPEEAFADLWRTIQRGDSWTGVVKNRRKDGGYYWVLANVTPIMERGETICYASVRVKPTREQVEAAEAVYARLRSGARGVRLSAGQPKPTGLRGLLARLMLWRLTGVRSRMLAWACLACALFLGASGVAIAALYDSMDTRELAAAGALLAAGVALIFASGWGFARSITGLLVTATDFTRQIAAGNLSTPLPPASLRDEIGALKFSLEVMRKSLVSITRDVHQGIESALHSAAEIADGNADLSAHTQRQAASLEEAAASMAQLASTVKQNASSAFEADQRPARPPTSRGAAARWWATRSRPCRASCRARRGFRRSSASSTASPSRPISWRSMPPWKPPGRRRRQGLRGGGGRGTQPGAEKRHGGARDQGTDRDIQPAGGRRRAPRGARRRRHAGHRDIREAGDADRQRDRRHLVRAAHRHRQRQPHHFRDRHRGAAQRGAGGTGQPGGRQSAHARRCAMPSRCSGLPAPRAPCPGVPWRRPSLPSPRRQIPLLERQLP